MYFMLWNAQFNNWWALKSVPSTDQFWVRKLVVCGQESVDWENWSLSGSSKSFWQKESRQYDSQIPTSFTLAWEWIGSMGRHWHPRMHNQTPCWCYAVLLCAPPENQEKVGQISHFSNFISMGFYLGKAMKMCMKVWVYYFFCWH